MAKQLIRRWKDSKEIMFRVYLIDDTLVFDGHDGEPSKLKNYRLVEKDGRITLPNHPEFWERLLNHFNSGQYANQMELINEPQCQHCFGIHEAIPQNGEKYCGPCIEILGCGKREP